MTRHTRGRALARTVLLAGLFAAGVAGVSHKAHAQRGCGGFGGARGGAVSPFGGGYGGRVASPAAGTYGGAVGSGYRTATPVVGPAGGTGTVH